MIRVISSFTFIFLVTSSLIVTSESRSTKGRGHLAEEEDFATDRHRVTHVKAHEKPVKPLTGSDDTPAFDVGNSIVFGADPKRQDEPYSFDDIFDPNLRPRSFGATWMSKYM